MARVSLDRQVAELIRLLDVCEADYARKVAKRELREGEAEYRLTSHRAAIDTLEWLRQNRTAVLAAKAAEMARDGEGNPA
jgi:hypothetical protein